MDWADVGVIASLVAAGGVLWERWSWWSSRPVSEVQIQALGERGPIKSVDEGDGERLGVLKNTGSEAVIGVQVVGSSCLVKPGYLDRYARIEPAEGLTFSFDVEPDVVDTAWILVSWSALSGRRNRRLAAWFPVSREGELEAIRSRQLDRSILGTAAVRLSISRIPSPGSVAAGSISTKLLRSRKPLETKPFRWWQLLWRRSLLRLFRVKQEAYDLPGERSDGPSS